MQDIRIDGLVDNTCILGFGSFFRRVNGSQWGINLELWPIQSKYSLRVSQLPILVRRRILNPSEIPKETGYKRHIEIESTAFWRVDTIASCPVFTGRKVTQSEAAQLCFSFQSTTGLNVYLPQLEFARALFLHDAYLSRTALTPDALKLEFDITVDKENDAATVHILDIAGYPKASSDCYASRRVLSWILLDPEARASYESISHYQLQNGVEVNGYRHWNFQFLPPLLTNFTLNIKGQYDQLTNSMFVWEITAIDKINHTVPIKVEFTSPRFKEQVKGEGQGNDCRSSIANPDKYNVHDGVNANSNTSHVLLHAPPVGISFTEPFEVTKVVKNKQSSANVRKDDGETNEANKSVSTEESDVTGSVPQAEWNLTEDTSDDAHLYINKFQGFLLMLEKLEEQYGCKIISKEIRKLPKVGRSERHLLKKEGLPRCMAVAVIQCNGQQFHILEVDTSDGAKALSTKLMVLKEPEKWLVHLVELERLLIKGSLSWPNDHFHVLCGDKHHSIPHPQVKNLGQGSFDSSSIEAWGKRFAIWLRQEV